MLVLWGALKSTVCPKDKVLALSNGLFGHGLGEMAESVGAEVRYLEAEDGRFIDKDILQRELDSFRPDVVTAVHCETPSGLLNPIGEVAPMIKESGALFCVDFVASAGGGRKGGRVGYRPGAPGQPEMPRSFDLSVLTVSDRA